MDQIESITKDVIHDENSEIKSFGNIYNVSKGTGKIFYQEDGSDHYSSCALLTFERNNKPFFCIMTNAHVIYRNYSKG